MSASSSRLTSSLFITYDGLLDPLGGSQILPYVLSVSRHPRPLHIVSFEKPDRFASGATAMQAYLDNHGIAWSPISFTRHGGKLGKLWDLARMYATCIRLQRQNDFGVIHCRSYQAMQVGCLLKRIYGVQTIFDMRGLWVDERVDGGLWPQTRLLNRLAYRAYKRIERRLLQCASHSVALTEAVVPELKRLAPEMKAPVTVIPCCADFDHFTLSDTNGKQALRSQLKIPQNTLVISYLGSLGTWYMLDEMLQCFAYVAAQRSDVFLLLITRDWGNEHDSLLRERGWAHLRDRIVVRAANRDEVPALLGISDVMLSFIKPAYSKMASSPTKLAEAFALGIPVISNTGVGDVDNITHELDAGAVVDLSDETCYQRIADNLDSICAKGGLALRQRARARFGLEVAEQSYRQIYDSLERQS